MGVNLTAFLLIIVYSAIIAFCVHWINTAAVEPVTFTFLAIVNACGIAFNVFTITR